MSEAIGITRADGILELHLNRPEKYNALTGPMYDVVAAQIAGAGADNEIRVVLITAAGPAFCAGNDIGDFLRTNQSGGEFTDSPQHRFVMTIARCAKPLVAAVQGQAVGVGMTMLLHCDLVYAAPDAKLSVPFVKMGLVPEAGSSLLLPQLLGPQRAARLFLLGESLGAEEARSAGLVTEIFPAADLHDRARQKAAALAAAPPAALAAARALYRGERGPLEARMEQELREFGRALRGPEAREAMAAFLEKRAPNFCATPAPSPAAV